MATKTAHDLGGLAVVTLGSGERVGRVDDVIFHPADGRIAGFVVGGGGLFARAKFLPITHVQAIGTDAVTINAGDTEALTEAKPIESDPALLAVKSLDGRPVLTQSGSVIGKVADAEVDTEALTVTALLLSTGLLDNALHGRPSMPYAHVQTIGADSVIVSDSYTPSATEPDVQAAP